MTRTLWTAAAVLILAASCTSGTEGLFASIEREQKVTIIGGLDDTATVSSMTELSYPAGTPVTHYFAAGGRALFTKTESQDNWSKQAIDGHANVTAVGRAGDTTTGTVWAVAGGSLYSFDTATGWQAAPWTDTDNAPYSLIPVRDGTGQDSGELLLTTVRTNGAYRYVYLIDSSGVSASAYELSADDLSSEVSAAVKVGSEYVVANRSQLYKLSGASTVDVIATDGTLPVSEYRGLLFVDDTLSAGHGGLYVSTDSVSGSSNHGGGLYRTLFTGTTLPSGTLTFTTVKANVTDTDAVALGSLFYNTVNTSIVIATASGGPTYEGHGYMEYSLGTGTFHTTPVTDSDNYTSTDLPTSTVNDFYYSGAGVYYLLTSSHGLWSWDSTDKTWAQQ